MICSWIQQCNNDTLFEFFSWSGLRSPKQNSNGSEIVNKGDVVKTSFKERRSQRMDDARTNTPTTRLFVKPKPSPFEYLVSDVNHVRNITCLNDFHLFLNLTKLCFTILTTFYVTLLLPWRRPPDYDIKSHWLFLPWWWRSSDKDDVIIPARPKLLKCSIFNGDTWKAQNP